MIAICKTYLNMQNSIEIRFSQVGKLGASLRLKRKSKQKTFFLFLEIYYRSRSISAYIYTVYFYLCSYRIDI